MIRAEAEPQFLYHLCAPDMRGSLLYPLNELRQHLPGMYAREREKWAGRESVLEFVVPGLGVPWANTVNLSTLDLQLLIRARQRLGLPISRLLSRPSRSKGWAWSPKVSGSRQTRPSSAVNGSAPTPCPPRFLA